MAWHDDSWKDGYDAWKLQEPDDYDDYEDHCDHEDADLDILDGRFRCMCGYSWHASAHEIHMQIEHEAAYYDQMERENRRQWWRDKTQPVRMLIFRVLERIWPRKACSVLTDDEIPF